MTLGSLRWVRRALHKFERDREGTPEVWEGSGGPTKSPGGVGRGREGSGVPPEVQEEWGGPPKVQEGS